MRYAERPCGRANCAEKRRSGGRYCGSCFAAANRRSHTTHRRERNARRRDRAARRDESARAQDCARAKLYVAISRGKLKKEPCVKCGSHEVTALILDPARWREVVWICREDRGEEIVRRPPVDAKERESVLAAVAALPRDVRERLYDVAARGPAGIRLAADAPLFIMRLIRAYRALPKDEGAAMKTLFPFAYAFAAAVQTGQMLFEGCLRNLEAGFQTFFELQSCVYAAFASVALERTASRSKGI